jgi:hypothetical protein
MIGSIASNNERGLPADGSRAREAIRQRPNIVGVLFILIGLGIRDVANRIRDLASRSPATA